MHKTENVKTPKVDRVSHNRKVSSRDVPGDGMAKKAAKGMESYYARQKRMMSEAMGNDSESGADNDKDD